MRTLLRVALAQHRGLVLACAALAALAALGVHAALPEHWVVVASVAVREPVAIHRLANPFAPAPRETEGLEQLPELLTSHERLVALVKHTGLVDQWEATRPWPLQVKDRLLGALRGPPSEQDQLEALVGLLEKHLAVTLVGNEVQVTVDWPARQAAYGLAEALLESLRREREGREVKLLDTAGLALEEQRGGVQTEIATRVATLQQELDRAALEHRRPAVEAEAEQLVRDQQRAAELTRRADEKELTAEVMRRANRLRFTVVKAPLLPRHPEGPSPVLWALLILAVAALGGLTGALAAAFAGGRVLTAGQLSRAVSLPVLAGLEFNVAKRPVHVRTPAGARALAFTLALATGAALGFSRGNPLAAVAPGLAVLGLWQLWVRPLKWPLLGLLLCAVTLDDPTDRPYYGLWHSPLAAPGRFFFGNIAWFTGFELSLLALFAIALARRVHRSGRRVIDPVQAPAPRILRLALVLSFVTVGWLVLFGLARGGIFREALWQFRAPLFMPALCLLTLEAFEFPADLKLVTAVLLFGTVVKTLLGAYFIFFIATPQGAYPPHTTGHNDTMIFVTTTVLAVLLVWEVPGWRTLTPALLILSCAGLAMVLNDRRIAYVDISLALAFVFLLSPWHPMKRFSTRWVLRLLPVILLYGGAGWNAHSRVFAPVQKVRAIVAPPEDSKEESSNVERDIENFNLTRSWQANMFLGQGFGHAFTEFVPSNDFGQSNYGHIGHNSVLWLLWIGGITGYTAVTLYLVIAFFLLFRTLPRASAPKDRVALLVAFSILLTYLNQAFGDMGMLAMQFDFFVAVAVAITGQFATRLEALEPAPEVR